jgi:signal transduction histidine kinase
MANDQEEQIKREAIGAFVHELRTPLTSMRMVLELGRRAGAGDGSVLLDRDLADMLDGALRDLQGLADALQETSWLERGRIKMDTGPTNLAEVIDTVRARTAERLRVSIEGDAGVEGPWDEARLTTALIGVAEATNRCGKGDGSVQLDIAPAEGACCLTFSAGTPGGEARPLNADLGFPFFRGYAQLQKMGGQVTVERWERAVRIEVELPL